jgi:hypothetical protein
MIQASPKLTKKVEIVAKNCFLMGNVAKENCFNNITKSGSTPIFFLDNNPKFDSKYPYMGKTSQ